MKIAFLTELPFNGKTLPTYPNMRTEFAWMYALDADHFNITLFNKINDYDHVFIIFPKGGPHWLWNDYEIYDQVYYYNMIAACDSIFCHNEHDTVYYKGMFQNKPVNAIHTLMIHDLIKDITPNKEDKTIIGGNMARWYGGFESYIVASEFNNPIFVQDSHAKRENENLIGGINHLPRMSWLDWMKNLSTFKYAVHMMPTIAAGTFALNCAYLVATLICL